MPLHTALQREIMGIKFGTDGWRAVLGKDFTDENVTRVTLAIGKYVADNFGFDKTVIIGYDPRNMAKEYASLCAEILFKRGFQVKLSSRVVPTPVLAYNAKLLNASAIMFTASHNPPEYLGMKYIPDYAGPATNEITDEIVANIDKEWSAKSGGSLDIVDFAPSYVSHLEKLIDFEKIKTLKTNIIFDGLYSASIGYFDEILKSKGIPFESMHMEHDVNFGGGMPDPKPKFLKDLIERVKNSSNSVGVANDGDADRFGVINERGEYVSPNEIIPILLKYLLFIPFGFLLFSSYGVKNEIRKRGINTKRCVLIGFLISTLIEINQFIFSIGLFEFDDIIGNTLGTYIGVMIARRIIMIIRERRVHY